MLGWGRYTIADMAIWPWMGWLVDGKIYGDAGEFLQVKEYKNVCAWSERVGARAAVKRGVMVNRPFGEKSQQLHNRHARRDFETKTQAGRRKSCFLRPGQAGSMTFLLEIGWEARGEGVSPALWAPSDQNCAKGCERSSS